MAITVSLVADSIWHRAVGSGCAGSIASPSAVSRLALPPRGAGGRGDRLSESCAERSFNSSKRRVCCAAAEAKTMPVVEVEERGEGLGREEEDEEEALLRAPLGWPLAGGAAPVLDLLGNSDAKVGEEQQASEEAAGPCSESLYRHWIATKFSAAVQSGSPPPRQRQENSERDNYYVNTGYAIRSLREELPNLFYQKMNFDIYRDDITFRDPRNKFSGIDNYKLIFWALRFHGRIFFKSLWVDIGRVWQPHDKVIMVRWTVRGVPRVPWEAQGRFDGTSEYKLDKDGKIYEHKVDNVIFNSPSPQRFKAISMLDLVGVKGGNPNPTPTFYAQTAALFHVLFPYLRQFTWVRFYWALTSTLALNNAGECRSQLILDA